MASRFWVGGTGTWDASDTSHWAASSGGASGSSVPGTSDTVTFDGSSGGGTVTVNATHSITSLTTTAFTGTLDFSANNNDINIGTVTIPNSAWSDSGSGAHTVNMGNGTWTLDSTSIGATVNLSGANLTLNANSSTISIKAQANITRSFTGNSKTFNNLTFNGAAASVFAIGGTNTFNSVSLIGPGIFSLTANHTMTTLAVTATSSLPAAFRSNAIGTARTITLTNNFTPSWTTFQDITFTGGTNTASNSLDFGHNSGITINPPSTGGTGASMARVASGF